MTPEFYRTFSLFISKLTTNTVTVGDRNGKTSCYRRGKTNLDSLFPFSSGVTPGEKEPSAPLSDLQQIPPIETGKYLVYIRNHPVASWDNIPQPVKREILLRACRERGGAVTRC